MVHGGVRQQLPTLLALRPRRHHSRKGFQILLGLRGQDWDNPGHDA
jgi:hypothetical protein